LVYDCHELETERNGLRGINQVVDRWVERALIRRCDAVVVVSESIADWYAGTYGIPRPAVVRNIPDVRGQAAGGDRRIFRERFGIPDEALVFVTQGALFAGRRIEELLRIFERAAPGRHLVVMGYGPLEELVRATAARVPNIHFQPAVPPGEVLRHTQGADVGIHGGENVCLSYYYSLPNKVFEYVLAGVPVLGNDWPEIRRLVAGEGCGWVVAEEAWQAAVDGLTWEAVAAARARTAAAAARYSWAQEETVLLDVYQKVLHAKI
jgi:glycosyltransferase involved in cell wall biosynthesis